MREAAKGDVADLNNIAKNFGAGASMGGAFLSYFTGKAKFTHLDIAGPSYRTAPYGCFPKHGTGFGVMTLIRLLSTQ